MGSGQGEPTSISTKRIYDLGEHEQKFNIVPLEHKIVYRAKHLEIEDSQDKFPWFVPDRYGIVSRGSFVQGLVHLGIITRLL